NTLGGLITWVKVVGLMSLVAWVGSWVVTALKERKAARTGPLDIAALVALVGGLLSVLLAVAQAERKTPWLLAGQPVATLLGLDSAAVLVAWVEVALWWGVWRRGRAADRIVVAAVHLALGLGVAGGLAIRDLPQLRTAHPLDIGARLGATFMGFVVLLRIA